MPTFAITVTRTASFGVTADNELQAQAIAKSALIDFEAAGLLEWTQDIVLGEEIPESEFLPE